MTVSLKELETWFQDRPKWLQDAARRIIQNGILTEQDYTDLLTLCIQEGSRQEVTFSGIPTGALDVVDTTKPLRLESISDVQGINALSPSRPLPFGKKPLCLVYGRTGAGKTGYVRLLKHACGARRPGDLLRNVFGTTTQPQTAKITVTEDGQTRTYQWNGTPISKLKGVEIYDAACGLVYVNEENEVAFEPWLLRFFTQLTKACTTLSEQIQQQIKSLVSKKPVFPAECVSTTAALWYTNLTANTANEEVDRETAWKLEHETELTDVSRRLAEPNPVAKAATLRRQKTLVLELVSELKKHIDSLSDEHCEAYFQIKSEAAVKRKAADEDARKVFEKAPLAGVGSETWRILWEAARQYSEEYAYKDQRFPDIGEGAHCVLCQRELDEESRDRFISFENFVKSELQRHATEAEKNLQKSADTFVDVRTADMLAIKMEAAGITEEAIKSMVIDFVSDLAQRRRTCLTANSVSELSGLPTKKTLIQLIQFARNLIKQARSYDRDAEGQNRPQLEQIGKELSAKKWLNQQRRAIEDEIARLKAVSVLEEAERLTNTKALTTHKSTLTDELITKAYKQRFQNELKHLGAANLSIELDKSRAEVGRVYHRISLRKVTEGVKLSDVLSEGEVRIVSIAAFLADTEGRAAKTPFIFDDPISSVDQVYEQATAKRIIQLTKSRQVVVFTHRLSLFSALEKYADKINISPEIVCLSKYVTGEVVDLPIEFRKTDKAVRTLLNERLAATKKAFAQGDEAYETEAKAICRDVRILIERVVESDLLAGIIKRFSPEVNTKGKIHHLANITQRECEFIDDYMTKYSLYEHSQAEESPVPLPKPDEIEGDLKEIAEFIKTIQGRMKS